MSEIIIDAAEFTARKQAHEYMKAALGSETYIGNSLDSLHDALTSISKDTHIIFRNLEAGHNTLGEYADKIVMVFADSFVENPHLSLSLE